MPPTSPRVDRPPSAPPRREGLAGPANWRFGPFTFDRAARLLWRDGHSLHAEPRILEFLAYLIERRERVVSKEELLRELWQGRTVSPDSLSVCASAARRLLGDTGAQHNYLRTRRGVGYQFVGKLQAPTEESDRVGTAAGVLPREFDTSFIGREVELETALAHLDRSGADREAWLLLSGGPGSGKTRFLQELCRTAKDRGYAVYWAASLERDSGRAFSAWIPFLQQEFSSQHRDESSGTRGDYTNDSSSPPLQLGMLPREIREDSQLETEATRRWCFEAMQRFANTAMRRGPQLFCFDNLHRADPFSLELLGRVIELGAASPLRIVASYRSGETAMEGGVPTFLATLAVDFPPQVLPLAGLSQEALGLLAAHRLGARPEEAQIAETWRLTEGTPRYIHLLLTAWASTPQGTGATPRAGGSHRPKLSEDFAVAAASHLISLETRHREALDVACVIGHSFSPSLLARILGCAVDEALARLQPGAARRAVRQQAEGVFSFSPPLLGDALYALLPPHRRVALHRAIAADLESSGGGDSEPDWAELAHHRAAANHPEAFESLLRAGEDAEGRRALGEAIRHYDRALALAGGGGETAGQRRPEALFRLGRAQVAGGEPRAGVANLHSAAVLARAFGAREQFARATLAMVADPLRLESGLDDPVQVALLHEAHRATPPGSRLRPRVVARLLLARAATGAKPEELAPLRSELADHIESLSCEPSELSQWTQLLPAHWLTDVHPSRSEEQLRRAAELARKPGGGMDENSLVFQLFAAARYLETGAIAEFEIELGNFARNARALQHPAGVWRAVMLYAARAMLRGEFETATALARQVSEVGSHEGDPCVLHVAALHHFLQHWEQGRLDAFLPDLQVRAFADPNQPLWRALLCTAYCELERSCDARKVFDALTRTGIHRGSLHGDWICTATLGMTLCCAELGDVQIAHELYRTLLPWSGREVVAVGCAVSCGAVDRYLGLLAATRGDLESADAHFQCARDFDTRLGARPWAAHCELDRARLFRRRGDAEAAKASAATAFKTARELGMQHLAGKADRLLRALRRGRTS